MFWDLTFAEYDALRKQYEAGAIEQLHGAAMVCSVLANVNRDPKKKPEPFTALDFLPVTDKSVSSTKSDSLPGLPPLEALKDIKKRFAKLPKSPKKPRKKKPSKPAITPVTE